MKSLLSRSLPRPAGSCRCGLPRGRDIRRGRFTNKFERHTSRFTRSGMRIFDAPIQTFFRNSAGIVQNRSGIRKLGIQCPKPMPRKSSTVYTRTCRLNSTSISRGKHCSLRCQRCLFLRLSTDFSTYRTGWIALDLNTGPLHTTRIKNL